MKYLYLILFFLIFYIPFSTQAVVENRGLSFQPITTIGTDTSITPNIADYKMPRMKEKPFSIFDTYSKRMILYPVILVILQIAFVGMFSIGAEAFGISRIIKMLSVALGSIVPFFLTRWLVRSYYSQHKKPKQGREPIATRTYNRLAVLLFALFALFTVTQFSAVRFSPLLFAGATFIGSSSDTIQAVETIKRKVKRDKKIVPEVVTEQKEVVAVNVTEQKEVVGVKEIPKVEIKDTIAKIIELPKSVVEKEPEVAPIIIEPKLILLERAGKFGFKDLDGNTVILPKYTIAYDFSEGLAQVQLDNKWGFINKKGVIICPIQYDDCNAFSEGLAVVQKNGVYGYINKDGKIRILPQYSSASNFKEGSANVEKDGRKFRINVQGKEW
jgi:WG containing repeat